MGELSEAHLQQAKQIFIAEGMTTLSCFLAKQSSTSEDTGRGFPVYTTGTIITYDKN